LGNIKSLQKIGLTSNEIAVYLFLLRNGPNSGYNLYTGLDLDKASTYRALNSLIKLQLVNRSGSTKNQEFFIEDVYKLNELINKKEKEIVSVRNDFNELLKQIEQNSEELYKSQNIEVFQGKDGYHLWMERRLQGNHKLIRELGSKKFVLNIIANPEYMPYMKKYIAKRIKKGISMYTLADTSEPHDGIDITDTKLLKMARQFPGKLDLDAFLSTFGGYFGYYTNKSNKFMGVIIYDPFMTKLLNSVFEVLWQQSKISLATK
jgi:sugar-specific transcriptional regulator TrmB